MLADFSDLWGPVRLVFSDVSLGRVREINVPGGSIRAVPHNPQIHPPLENEVLCHWISFADDDGEVGEVSESFSHTNQLLIGATTGSDLKYPDYALNASCNCDKKTSPNEDFRFDLGTSKDCWKKDTRSLSANFSKFVGVTMGVGQKFHPGMKLKDVILG